MYLVNKFIFHIKRSFVKNQEIPARGVEVASNKENTMLTLN